MDREAHDDETERRMDGCSAANHRRWLLMRWQPPYQVTERGAWRVPTEGDVIGFDYRAFTVLRVTPRDDGTITLALQRDHGPAHEHERGDGTCHLNGPERSWMFHAHIYRNGRVPLCSCCGHPWPCRLADAQKEGEAAIKRLEKRMALAQTPGTCYACGEVITQRQQSASYGFEHADLPGYAPPRFHLRKSCRGERVAYLGRLAKLDPEQMPAHDDGGRLL